jgi:cytoskeleton protein RodZ
VSTGIGTALREAREEQGRSVEEVALQLRARVAQVAALESEDFAAFGGDVYAKGFLKSYAQVLGLEPQPLLDTYRREISHDDVRATTLVSTATAPPRTRSAPPAWVAWVLASVVVLAGLAFLGLQGGGRAPDVATPEDEVAGPPPAPAEEAPEADDDAPADQPAPEPAPEPEPEPQGVDLLLALEEAVWMQVIVDGALVLETTVQAGETQQFTGEQEIQVRFGNAGGVRAQLNGEDLGAQGGRGEVVNVLFTPEGAQTL